MYNFFRGRFVIDGALRSRWGSQSRLQEEEEVAADWPPSWWGSFSPLHRQLGDGPWKAAASNNSMAKHLCLKMIHHRMLPPKTSPPAPQPFSKAQSGNSTGASAKKFPCSLRAQARLHQCLPVSAGAAMDVPAWPSREFAPYLSCQCCQ